MTVNIEFINEIPEEIIELAKNYDFKAKYEQFLFSQINNTLYIGLNFETNPVEVNDFDKILFTSLGKKVLSNIPTLTKELNINVDKLKIEEIKQFDLSLKSTFYKYNYREGIKIKDIKVIYKDFIQDENDLINNGINFCKEVLDKDSNIINPETYINLLNSTFDKKKKHIKVKVFNNEDLKKMNMNMLLSVGRGSKYGSKMFIIEISPKEKVKKTIAFVGKGLTFDTGGVNIKENGSSFGMHDDMGGSATIFGLAKIFLDREQLKDTKLIFLSGIVENVTDGQSYQPGEILENLVGQTAIIKNTDAEGRLTLADVAPYAILNYKPDEILTLATLTGHAISAFTNFSAPLFSNNKKFSEKVYHYFLKNEEESIVIPMPSKVYSLGIADNTKKADISNTGSYPPAHGIKPAGSQTAAAFVIASTQPKLWKKEKENLPDSIPHLHIDIAGTAVDNKGFATGYGIKSLYEYIINV